MKYQHVPSGEDFLLLPQWGDFSPDKELDELTQLLHDGTSLVKEIISNPHPTFDSVVMKFEDFGDRIGKCWGPVSHLNNVMQAAYPNLQEIHDKGVQRYSKFYTDLALNTDLYEVYKKLQRDNAFGELSVLQQKLITDAIEDFELAGVGLSAEKKTRLAEINVRLSELANIFSNNVQKAQESWSEHVLDVTELEGVPEGTLFSMAETARARGIDGYVVTIHQPIYIAIMEYAVNRKLRERVYEAYVTRASEKGPDKGAYDNTPIMKELIRLRKEKASLLGYENYNAYALAKKMAPSVATIDAFYSRLIEKSRPVALSEYAELCEFSRRELALDELKPWDVAFATQALKKKKYTIDQEKLREYFPKDQVLSGLFELVEKLFGMSLTERPDVSVWREGVKYYDLFDVDGTLRGGVFADLYAESGKRPGAWMDVCVERMKKDNGVQLPIAYFNCNFTKPKDGEVATLTHDEIETVFHEFGHVIHHIMGKMPYIDLGMGRVERDAIEYPSQIMENWCWEKEMLQLLSCHVRTKKPISDEEIKKLSKTKLFHIGTFLTRQLALGSYDWILHRDFGESDDYDIAELWNDTWNRIAVTPSISWSRYAHSFLHIFEGGYAAGYYGYLWAEVLAADVFSEFKEQGIFDRQTGLRYLHEVLEVGSSRPMLQSFRVFRGRDPDPEMLLIRYGLIEGK